MGIRIKAKSFGPIGVRYTEEGEMLYVAPSGDSSPSPQPGSPVDHLLASLAGCIAKSLEIAAGQKDQTLEAFTVEVSGKKATDLPNRLGSVDIRVLGHLTEDAEMAAELLRQAKSICTVSNTMNCPFTLDLDRSA